MLSVASSPSIGNGSSVPVECPHCDSGGPDNHTVAVEGKGKACFELAETKAEKEYGMDCSHQTLCTPSVSVMVFGVVSSHKSVAITSDCLNWPV